jgi:hypothetical protein
MQEPHVGVKIVHKSNIDISIGSLGGWMKKELCLPSEEEGNDREKDENGEALVRVVHPGGQRPIIDSGSGSLGPSFHHWGDNGEYVQWLRYCPESEYDVMVTSHHPCLSDERLSSRRGEYSLLEPCKVFTEEEWIKR